MLRVSKQNKIDVINVNIWLIQSYYIFIKKFSSLSSLALIHKSIRFTTVSLRLLVNISCAGQATENFKSAE